jgi:hypothetical protein
MYRFSGLAYDPRIPRLYRVCKILRSDGSHVDGVTVLICDVKRTEQKGGKGT